MSPPQDWVIRTDQPPDSSLGGIHGFPVWVRRKSLQIFDKTESYEVAADSVGFSSASVRRWEHCLLPYRMVGGSSKNDLTGEDQLLLSIFQFIYPNALADDICLFIFANGVMIYSRQTITHRCCEIGLIMKRSSGEAYAALFESSLHKLHWFITLPPPIGVVNIMIHTLTDIDETGFYIRSISTTYGHGHTTYQIRHPSHYNRN